MSGLELNRGRIQQIAWGGSLLLMLLFYSTLSLLRIQRPQRVEVPGAELMTWVRQIYQAPSHMNRVRERMRERVELRIPRAMPRVTERSPADSPERRYLPGLARDRDALDILEGDPGRDRSRFDNRVTLGDRSLFERPDLPELPARAEDTRTRDSRSLIGRLDTERDVALGEGGEPGLELATHWDRLVAYYHASPVRELGGEFRRFAGCGAKPARGGEIMLGRDRWQSTLCLEEGSGEASLLLQKGDELLVMVLAGDGCALRSLKRGELFREGASRTIIARYSRLDDAAALHATLLQFLEGL